LAVQLAASFYTGLVPSPRLAATLPVDEQAERLPADGASSARPPDRGGPRGRACHLEDLMKSKILIAEPVHLLDNGSTKNLLHTHTLGFDPREVLTPPIRS
jgi:hypothetical protein